MQQLSVVTRCSGKETKAEGLMNIDGCIAKLLQLTHSVLWPKYLTERIGK